MLPLRPAAHAVLIGGAPERLASLRGALEGSGFLVQCAADPLEGLECVRTGGPELVLVMLTAPHRPWLDLVSVLSDAASPPAVIVVSESADEEILLRCFASRAADYVTQAVGVREIAARATAVMRRARTRQPDGSSEVRFGDITIVPPARAVYRAGTPVKLSPLEYDLLLTLHRHRGRVVSPYELSGEIGRAKATGARAFVNHVASLRRKLEHNRAQPRHIVTVRSNGYLLRP